jgi:predicted small secreted protein
MKMAFIALTLILATAAVACNTVKGAGKDVKAAGNAVSDAADDAKPN